ncbi:MAG: hypothetical protein FWG70_11265 [Oscillospiraceae bacterium]|nr:hypothetical protein [Oscillospiraceae bacterium]
MIEVKIAGSNKKDFLDLLLLADESDNYEHLMFEDGFQLVDMVYLKRNLS